MFRQNNCTLTGSGIQDIYWSYLPVVLASSCHKVEKIEGETMINCDDYGRDESGFTLSREDFIKKWEAVKLPSYVRFAAEAICARFGAKVTHLT